MNTMVLVWWIFLKHIMIQGNFFIGTERFDRVMVFIKIDAICLPHEHRMEKTICLETEEFIWLLLGTIGTTT